MFKSIIAKNFQSWENLEFELQTGVTLIEGYNYDDNSAEGSGKSSILNALCWGLFGKLPKDANTDDVIKQGKKSCKVEVILENGYKIIRSRKPNDLSIIFGGETLKGASAKETQKTIENLIGVSYAVFTQSVYFAQNDSQNFVNAKEEDRVTILSQILSLDKFDKARDLTLKKARSLEPDRIRMESKLDMLKQMLRSLEKESEKISEVYKNRKDSILQKLSNLKLERERTADLGAQLSSQYKALKKDPKIKTYEIEKLDEIKGHLILLKAERSTQRQNVEMKQSISSRIRRLINSIEKKSEMVVSLKSDVERGKCPTCGGALSAEHNVDADIARLESDSKAEFEEIADLEVQLKSIPDLDVDEYDDLIKKLSADLIEAENARRLSDKRASDLQKIELEQDRVLAELKNIDSITADLKGEFSELDKKALNEQEEYQTELRVKSRDLKELNAKYQAVKEQVAQLETLKRSFKEIKYYTFDNILAELTNRTNKYLLELFESSVQCEIKRDESGTKIAIDITIDNLSRKFGLFSGGQSRRIQLAVDLALGDIVANRSDKPLRLKIFDEYFKDLSESSMSRILHLFEKIDVPTLLVEHNSVFKSLVNSRFEIEYKNGTSRRL